MVSVTNFWAATAIASGLSVIVSTTTIASTPLSPREAKSYASALKDAERGNWQRAHRQAAKIRGKLPAKLIRWMELASRGNRHSFRTISEFVLKHPDWPLRGTLRRRAEEAITGKTSHDAILKWFEQYPPLTSSGRIRYVEATLAIKPGEQSRKLIRETWVSGNFGRKQERMFYRKYRRHLTKADHSARLDRLIWQGQTTRARRALRYVDKNTQKVGMARIALRTFRGGVDWHLKQVPEHLQKDLGLVFERAKWRRRKGKDDGAYELLKNIPADAPHAARWWVERSIMARRLLAKGHISEAYRLANANGLSSGARFVEAEWLAGWIALRHLREPNVALRHFERIGKRVSYPISKARAAYWAGRAAEDAGDSKAATKLFADASRHSTTYYGQLAAARQGANIALNATTVLPSAGQKAAFERDERVRAVRILSQVRARARLRPFMFALLRASDQPGHQKLVAKLANEIGRRDFAVRAGRKSYRIGSPLPDIAYPVISMKGNNPEQALVHAIVRQESNFDGGAISHAGARGLMQLMPGTARGVARQLRLRYSRTRLTRDLGYNLRLGQAYLGQMISKFDGSYILAIASYNAGPSAAARWVRQFGDPREPGVDVIDWVESIPYRETRNYVQRVIENLQVYRARMGGPMLAQGIVNDLKR